MSREGRNCVETRLRTSSRATARISCMNSDISRGPKFSEGRLAFSGRIAKPNLKTTMLHMSCKSSDVNGVDTAHVRQFAKDNELKRKSDHPENSKLNLIASCGTPHRLQDPEIGESHDLDSCVALP